MATQKKNRFISVDPFRASFSDVSVKAIYELYRVHSKVTHSEFVKTPFREMVEFLRVLQDPNYTPKHLS